MTEKMIPRKSFVVPLFIFLFAYAVRLVYLVHFQENPYFDYIPPLWDQASYDLAAREFASGNYSFILNYGEKFSAFYKYFLGVVYLLAGREFFWIWCVQFLFGALSVVLVYSIALRLFDQKVALLSSILFALYGPQIYYEAILYREFLATFFVLLSCYAALRYADHPNSKNAAWTALPFSLMVQCRPNLILLTPFIIWFLISADKDRGFVTGSGNRAGVFVLTLLVTMVPLWVSSVWVHKRFVFIDDSGPRTFLLGNLPGYSGKEWEPRLFQPFIDQYGKEPLDYILVLKYLIPKIVQDPVGFILLYMRKGFFFFYDYEIPSSMNYYLNREFSFILTSPFSHFAIYASLGLTGMVLLRNRFFRYRLLYLFSAGIFVSVILFYITARFRLPMVPFLIIFSSYTVFYLYDKLRKGETIKFLGTLTCVSLLFYCLLTPRSMEGKYIRPIDYANFGTVYANNPRFRDKDKTGQYYIRAWNASVKLNYRVNQTKPLLADYLLKEGDNYFKEGKYEKADRLYEFSETIDYLNGSTHSKHALALKEGGHPEKAIFHAQESVLIEPENSRFHLLLMQLYDGKGDSIRALFHAKKVLALWPEYNKKTLVKNRIEFWEGWLQSQKKMNHPSPVQVNQLVQEGQLEEALKILGRLMPFRYDDPGLHSLLGELYMKKKDDQKAVVAFRHSVMVQPDQPDLYRILGDLAARSGQINPAILYYRKALIYRPNDPEAKKNLQNYEALHATTPFDTSIQDF